MRTWFRVVRAVLAAMLLLLPWPAVPAEAAAGAVDPGFGSSGVVQTDVALRDAGYGLVVQPDGRSISIGTADSTGIVVRHRADGSLDPTFGTGGVVRTPATASLAAGAVQPDGRIVAVGTNATFDDLVVVRYLPTGALDPTFGSGGLVQTDFGSADQGYAVAVQVDGRLVAAGRSGDSVAVARYLANGTPDPAFAGDGTTTTSGPAGGSLEASAVGILSTGGVVVGGRATAPAGTPSMLLARYTPAGSLDGTFGAGGMVAPAEQRLTSVTSLLVQSADRVVVAGAVDTGPDERAAVARYLSNGSVDSAFGSGGATVALPPTSRFEDLVVDGAGGLLAAGTVVHLSASSAESGHNIVATARFTAEGAVDPSFGCAGSTQTEVAPELGGRGTGIGTTADGRILVGGTAFEAATFDLPARTDLLLVRLLSDGPSDIGYWIARDDGGVSAFGGAGACSSMRWYISRQAIIGHAGHPSGDGYWLLDRFAGVFPLGAAPYFGSPAGTPLNRPLVGMARTPSGNGYWLVASDGGIFAYGDARFFGSTGGIRLNQPVVGMAPTPSGNGYWLVASDGGIFAYGDARFFGSTGGIRLNQPVVGMAPTPSGNGYWLVASDGGIFAYGDARFAGSTGGIRLNRPVVGMAATPSGTGYWLAGADGGIFAFNAPFLGSTGGQPFTSAAVAISGR